jgi:hypothetical protein
LASGSEAIEVATGTGLATTRKRATATKVHDFDFALSVENCGRFMAGEVLCNLSAGIAQSREILKEDSNPVTDVFATSQVNCDCSVIAMCVCNPERSPFGIHG